MKSLWPSRKASDWRYPPIAEAIRRSGSPACRIRCGLDVRNSWAAICPISSFSCWTSRCRSLNRTSPTAVQFNCKQNTNNQFSHTEIPKTTALNGGTTAEWTWNSTSGRVWFTFSCRNAAVVWQQHVGAYSRPANPVFPSFRVGSISLDSGQLIRKAKNKKQNRKTCFVLSSHFFL